MINCSYCKRDFSIDDLIITDEKLLEDFYHGNCYRKVLEGINESN